MPAEPIEIRARHADFVYGACALGDGFATCSGDATIKLWGADGGFVTSLRAHDHNVSGVRALSRNRLVSAGFDRRVLLWDVSRREVLRTFGGCKEWVVALAVSHDERRLATLERLGAMRVWDLETGKLVARARVDVEWAALALSPDGRRVFVGRNDGPIEVWDVEKRAKVRELANDSRVRDFAIEPVTQRLVAISTVVRSWTLDALEAGPILRGHHGTIVGVSTADDFTATGDDAGSVLYWDLEKGPIGGRRRDPIGASAFAGRADGGFAFGASNGEVMVVSAL